MAASVSSGYAGIDGGKGVWVLVRHLTQILIVTIFLIKNYSYYKQGAGWVSGEARSRSKFFSRKT